MNLDLFWKNNLTNIEKDLKELVSINTSLDLNTKTKEKPFGNGVDRGFNYLKEMCIRDNVRYIEHEGFAFSILVGETGKELAILNHIDTVPINDPELWKTNPFVLTKKNGLLFGRGSNDNKGPLVAIYYLLLYIKNNSNWLNLKIRLLVGGAEETTWEGIDYYKKHNSEPDFSFSPDGDFPMVYAEKGILSLNIKKEVNNYKGAQIISKNTFDYNCNNISFKVNGIVSKQFKSGLQKSRNPNRSFKENAVDDFINWYEKTEQNIFHDDLNKELQLIKKNFLSDWTGKSIGIETTRNDIGENSLSLTHLQLKENQLNINLNIRYDKTLNYLEIIEKIKLFYPKTSLIHNKDLHIVDLESKLVTSLMKAYKKVTGSNDKPTFFSGGSYARSFKNSVAFGTTFKSDSPNSHGPNENVSINSLRKAIKIYLESIIELNKIKGESNEF